MIKMPGEWVAARTAGAVVAAQQGQEIAAKMQIVADGEASRWWMEMSDASKEEYITEHPNSKYADMHRKAKQSGGGDLNVKPKEAPAKEPEGKEEHAPAKSEAPQHEAPKKPSGKSDEHKQAVQDHDKLKKKIDENGGKATDDEWAAYDKAMARMYETLDKPEAKVGSPARKKAAAFVKKKSGHIFGHLRENVAEWKQAGQALKKLATGKGITKEDKHAMTAAAADIAAVTASLLVSGGAAHGVIAFVQHFGSHLVQEMLVKAAVKGTAGAAGGHGEHAPAHHASVLTTAGTDDQIAKDAIAMLMDFIENGDMKAYAAKIAEAKKAKGKPQPKQPQKPVHARIDMSAEVVGRGLCPECKEPMVTALVGNSSEPSWICPTHRIALPLPDGQEE